MSITKSHAIVYLTRNIGEADGEWTSEEMDAALMNDDFSQAVEEAPDWAEKVLSGELTHQTAIYVLTQLNREDRMDCLIICLTTAMADGVVDDSETEALGKIISHFKDISVKELLDEFKARQ